MARMNETDLKQNNIYENYDGEICQLKHRDEWFVYCKMLKEKDGKYIRHESGMYQYLVEFETETFLMFWKPMVPTETEA